jgi:hypothetical protein
LPFAANLDTDTNTDTNTFVNVLCPTLIANAKLKHITILELKWVRLLVGRGKVDMVGKTARAALGVIDKKSAARFAPDLGMSVGDHLGLEHKLIQVDSIGLRYGHPGMFCEPTYTSANPVSGCNGL